MIHQIKSSLLYYTKLQLTENKIWIKVKLNIQETLNDLPIQKDWINYPNILCIVNISYHDSQSAYHEYVQKEKILCTWNIKEKKSLLALWIQL